LRLAIATARTRDTSLPSSLPRSRIIAAFASRDYAIFWMGSFISNVGTWMQSTALGWLVYERTRSGSWLGGVSLAGSTPILVLGLLGGAVADRIDQRRILVGTQLAACGLVFLLSFLTATGHLELWHVLGLSAALGTANALYVPTVHASIPTFVPTEQLLTAISLNSVNFNLARILGPALAGVAYGAIGATGCFALNAASFGVMAGAVSLLRIPPRQLPVRQSLARDVFDGFAYARRESAIRSMLILAAGVSFFGFPYIILMPAVARDVLGLGPDGLGFLLAMIGLGAVIGGLGLASVAATASPRIALAAAAAFAIALVGFTTTRTAAAAGATLVAVGLFQIVCIASINTTLQTTVVNEMRGRVMSMVSVSLFGISPLGAAVLGTVADWIGVQTTVACGGAAVLTLTTTLYRRA
jgi:predicted MFS family arabinose efflux permease